MHVYVLMQVPLGVQLKNENVIGEMVDIMTETVPTVFKLLEIKVTGESTVTVKADHFHNILFGGDQLTGARARGAQHVRENSVDGGASTCLQRLACTCNTTVHK